MGKYSSINWKKIFIHVKKFSPWSISYAGVGLDKYPEYKSEKYDAVNLQSKVIALFHIWN